MERQIKERLVGAAVLMAAAIILIPEMLAGPDRHRDAGQGDEARINFGAGAARDAPIKTYTIDLTRPPGTQAANEAGPGLASQPAPAGQGQPLEADAPVEPTTPATSEGTAATKAEMAGKVADAAATPARPAVDPAGRPRETASGQEREAPAPSRVATAQPTAAATTASPSKPLASQPAAPMSQGWAVQLGSFSQRATAERMVKKLRAKGHEAFVMPIKSGSTTLYRVRVGPMKDRASAEAAQRRLKSVVRAATVVMHP